MSSDYIEFDQLLHGYDNGHRLLAASLRMDSRDERALLALSDLSGPSVTENFLEYLTGYVLPSGTHYALAKTWYANEMERPGCVWTHTFLIPVEDIEKIVSLANVQERFFRPRLKSGYRYADRIVLNASDYSRREFGPLAVLRQESVMCGVENLYGSDEELIALVAESGTQFESLALRLWAQLWPSLRPEFSFCTGALSKRSLAGRPLLLQCGPERGIRDIKSRPEKCKHEPWVDDIVFDLEHNSPLREFLKANCNGSQRRSAVSTAARVYGLLEKKQSSSAIDAIIAADQQVRVLLQDVVLGHAVRELSPIEFLNKILDPRMLDNLHLDFEDLLRAVRESLIMSSTQTYDAIHQFLDWQEGEKRRFVVTALAKALSVEQLVGLADSHADLYTALVLEEVKFFYSAEFWRSQLPLLSRIEMVELAFTNLLVERTRLVSAILESEDADLCSELIKHLSQSDLMMLLNWLEKHDWSIALRPPWLSFLRRFESDVALWVDNHSVSTQEVLILANVVSLCPQSNLNLSEPTVLSLAACGQSLISERHEVAAFIYTTTSIVRNLKAASYCFSAFRVLHNAIAESRLSNRAWQLLECHLLPLPDEQWDACEKLRRAILYFTFHNSWPIDELWEMISENINLFYDFLKTAKGFSEGRRFFWEVQAAGVRGEFRLTKQQFKEIKKLL